MIKIDENEPEDLKKCSSPFTVISHADSELIEGNGRYVSIHQILCQTYNDLFKLNFRYTKSHSYSNCNVLIEKFPMIIYGVNIVKMTQIPFFLKKVTSIDVSTLEKENNDMTIQIQDLEKLIFADLQFFISYYNYCKANEERSFLKKLGRIFFQPISSIKAYFNDKRIIHELNDKLLVNSKNESLKFIHSINKKIEGLIEALGGEKYCRSIEIRKVNSFDLMVYSAYKAQCEVFGEKLVNENFHMENLKILTEVIDRMLKTGNVLKYQIAILPGDKYIVPRIPEEKNADLKDYFPVQVDTSNGIRRKVIISGIFFGILLYLKFLKK